MFYTVYQITNLLNDKIYIGKHVTCDLDDGYMGSGRALRHAQEKYGIEHFKKEILFVFDNVQEMDDKERELVTPEFVAEKTTYNLKVGGDGGWDYVNHNLPNGMSGKSQTDEQRRVAAKIRSEANRTPGFKGVRCDWNGRTHTSKSKQKISDGRQGQSAGKNNSQYGKRWITDGTASRKIKKTDQIPTGWRAGRKM